LTKILPALSRSNLLYSGQSYVPLNTLAENGQQDLWVPVGSNGAQVHLLLKRYQRKVEDLESDSLLDKLNARLLYFLNLARLRLGDMGFDIKLSVEVVVVRTLTTLLYVD
jgi:hypothetical protein